MPHGCKIYDQSKAHYLTLTIVEWVDIFTRKIYKDSIIDSLKYFQKNKGLELKHRKLKNHNKLRTGATVW